MSQDFPSYVLRVIPARAEEPVTLATAMQALVLNARAPTALEIVGTARERGFQVRTVNEAALTHMTTQLRARYPQIDCRQMLSPEEDPFHLGTGETLSVVELALGAAVYFPLRQWSERDLRQKGADPVLGVLAALDAIPSPLRAVAQLALVPAAPTWSKQYQRKALEHALEPERQRQQPSHTGLLSLPLLCLSALALVLTLYTQQRLPAWADRDITQLLQGHVPSLSVGQQLLLVALTGVPLVLWWLVRRIWCGWLSPPLYDMKLVGAHTSQMAYQLRLRLYVIGPGTPWTWTRGMWIAWRLAARMGSLSYAAACKIMAWVWMKRTTSLSTVHCWKYRFRTRVGAWWRTHWQPLVRQVREVSGWKRLLVVSGALGYLGRDGAHRFESGIEWVRLWSGRFWESIERLQTHWRWERARRQERHALLDRLVAAYRQFHLASGNYFLPRAYSTAQALRLVHPRKHGWQWRTGWWTGVRSSSYLLSAEAIGALWHLPQSTDLPELALLERRLARTLLIPTHLARLAESGNRSVVGISEHAGHALPFSFPAECLRSHLLLLGKSGEGKSTAMASLAIEAMQQGGLVVIDPHGDLVDYLLGFVPSHRLEDVVIIDLSDREYAVGLNPLDVSLGRGRDKAIMDLLSTLSHIWHASWGSRMEISFTYALRTLYEANRHVIDQLGSSGIIRQHTLLDVIPVLTNESFCHALLEHTEDQFIRRWWYTYYDPLSLYMQRDRADPVLSKIAKFESQIARRIVGQSQATINFMECIQEERLVFIKLAKGVVGEDVASLLGAMFVGLLQFTLAEQGNVAAIARKQLPIMIDEFQVLKGVDWSILAELRKYGAAFYLATQSLEYLREREAQVLPTVLANVKQLMVFHASAQDAATIHQDLGVEPEDIISLESYQCYVKLTYQHRRQPTFSLIVHPPPQGNTDLVADLYTRSRDRYMRPAVQVDQELFDALVTQLAQYQNKNGRARQERGYRGRKSQEHQAQPRSQEGEPPAEDETNRSGADVASSSRLPLNPAAMGWNETVGEPEGLEDGEQEVDPGEYE